METHKVNDDISLDELNEKLRLVEDLHDMYVDEGEATICLGDPIEIDGIENMKKTAVSI